MTKLLTWSLHAPATSVFETYYALPDGEPWNSPNYVLVDENAPETWDYRKSGFIRMIEKYTDKFYAIGLHNFEADINGRIVNGSSSAWGSYILNDNLYGKTNGANASATQTVGTSGNITFGDFNKYTGPDRTGAYIRKYNSTRFVYSLNGAGTDEATLNVVNGIGYIDGLQINFPNITAVNDKWVINFSQNNSVPALVRQFDTSLRYLIYKYPSIKWSLQFLAVTNDTNGAIVEAILDNTNGAQDTFITEIKNIMQLYLDAGFTNIKGVEIDFEKTTSRTNEQYEYRDLLIRIKNEVCIPLGLELRVNLYAMTGELLPSYYAWHNYSTIASGKDSKGNPACDEYQLMTYDFSWGGSAPGPSTPTDWLGQVLDHVQTLDSAGSWHKEDVFIGNAGYGRRWPLGEWDAANNRDRYGSTMDYKQLIQAQNGGFIHSAAANPPGENGNAPDGNWYFNDQDFIPIAGFNDESSGYQRTYLNVYDRFNMTLNGGASFNNVNLSDTDGYGTTFSRRQYPIFGGVAGYDFVGTNNMNFSNDADTSPLNLYPAGPNNGNGLGGRSYRYVDLNGVKTDTLYVAGRAQGIDLSSVLWGYQAASAAGKPAPSVDGEVTYTINANGNYYLVALVYFPFFGKSNLPLTINGVSGYQAWDFGQEWYPFMQTQEKHFVKVAGPNGDGTFTFNGPTTIQVGANSGAQIWGFVACSSFDYNIRGGDTTFPTVCYPMKRRDTVEADGTVTIKDAQYPQVMRIVGEVLLRSPRPAIIWEDVFGSYDLATKDVTAPGFNYYVPMSSGGYSMGTWSIQGPVDQNDVQHAWTDARTTPSQFALANQFASNIAVDVQVAADPADINAVYGIRALITESSDSCGYSCLLDFGSKTVYILYEVPGQTSTIVASKTMSSTLADLNGTEIRLRVYVFENKISFWIADTAYFDRIDMPVVPAKGAYAVYCRNTRLSLYKYNVSCMDRYERMERLDVIVNGQTYSYDTVERKDTTVFDEWDLIQYSGFPAEVSAQVADTQNPDGSGNVATTVNNTNTILDTQVDANYPWSLDYHNKALTTIPSWQGKQDVIVRFKDAGIWFRNFYVGDNEGMSVAYNGDRTAFIQTVNLITQPKYNCKGIGMWTLGQEDPTIYPYISD